MSDITPGTRLGPYEVVSRIGAGGMGEVYKARDTRLDRSVAIKVLSTDFSRNAELKLRFEREAKTISQLNHPHICTLYDVGDDYLVMELLEGETLAERIAKGPLPLGDMLKFGAQIADALDRAHRAGIVHRDLKPANVMITKAGAKLLDFGLAKTAVQQIDPNSATLHHDKALTTEGTILGTFQYMAPEQLEAEEADARTDIFALGAVLYEMATGKRAFQGRTKTSLIAAIVGAQPQPVSQLMPLSPPALDHVIQKCLEKEREDRWQSAHDVAEELKWIATTPAGAKARTARGAKIAIAAAVVLAIALAAMTAMYLKGRNVPKPRMAFAILPPKGFTFGTHRLSPDGTMIAFDATNSKNEGGIWIRRTDELEPRRLTTDPEDRLVEWSPDSKWIAYIARRQNDQEFRRIAAGGGTSEVISRYITRVHSMSWAPDGTIVYSPFFGEGISVLRPDGTEPVAVTALDAKRRESFHVFPHLLSDGKRFLYAIHTVASQPNEIWAGSIDGKSKQRVFRADALVGIARGDVYFMRDGVVYAQKLDQDDLRLEGEPRRVAQRAGFFEPDALPFASLAQDGALLFSVPVESTVEMAWYDRGGRRLEKVYEGVGLQPHLLSPDGKKIGAMKFELSKGANDVYVIDLERGLSTRLTSGLSNNQSAVWSPAGDRVYFASDRDGPYDVYGQAEDGATPPVLVWKSAHDKEVHAITPAGDALLCVETTRATRGDIWLVPIGAPEKRKPLIATEADEGRPSFSPDGKWLAFRSDRSGRYELYVRRLEGGRTTQVSTSGAGGYIWGADGTELIMRTLEGTHRVAVPLTFSGNEATPGKPQLLFTPPRGFSIHAATAKGLLASTLPDPTDFVVPLYYDSAPLQ